MKYKTQGKFACQQKYNKLHSGDQQKIKEQIEAQIMPTVPGQTA